MAPAITQLLIATLTTFDCQTYGAAVSRRSNLLFGGKVVKAFAKTSCTKKG